MKPQQLNDELIGKYILVVSVRDETMLGRYTGHYRMLVNRKTTKPFGVMDAEHTLTHIFSTDRVFLLDEDEIIIHVVLDWI